MTCLATLFGLFAVLPIFTWQSLVPEAHRKGRKLWIKFLSKLKSCRGRTCEKYRNKVGMKVPYATLLLSMLEKTDEEDYITFVARHIFATDVV